MCDYASITISCVECKARKAGDYALASICLESFKPNARDQERAIKLINGEINLEKFAEIPREIEGI